MPRILITAAAIVLVIGANAFPVMAGAGDPEFCPPADNCWDDDVGQDTCNPNPPEACVPGAAPIFEFIDDMDGADDGQLFALGDRDPTEACGTLTVDQTGYYSIFDIELSESCDTQRDETGYVTIVNSCNSNGWANERNAGNRFLILDNDNTPPCTGDPECGAGRVCRTGGGGQCCVPDSPVFVGTFLLVAGEPNTICLHHWCPEHAAELAAGNDLGFVTDGCQGVNSIHFRISNALACEDKVTLQECSWGCFAGDCADDPCDSVDCPLFCQDGECLDTNPCDGLDCAFGCINGYCLQEPDAPGPDADGDGYSQLGDCDDNNADVNPGQTEVCGNGLDDNCDGITDEDGCTGGADPGGCGCQNGSGHSSGLLLLFVIVFAAVRRRKWRP